MLSKIENDRVMPSIGMLHRLVSELGTNIGALLDSSESEPTSWITHNHERPVIPRASSDPSVAGVSLEWLTPFPVPNLFQSAIHIIEPGARSDGEVHHQGEDFVYIMHGSIELSIDGQIHILEEGDSFFFPSDLPHAYSNPGATVARVLWFNTPPTF
jgi:quercetin dioxygenase-like cupin family protein